MDNRNIYHSGRTRIQLGNENIENITAIISPNVEVRGRFLMEAEGVPKWSALQLQLRSRDTSVPLMSRSSLATVAADGTLCDSKCI